MSALLELAKPFPKQEVARFLQKVAKSPGCWEWTAGRFSTGYGGFNLSYVVGKRRAAVLAHRYSYELHVGPIPTGLQIHHICGNRTCVNPAHLEPLTQRENLKRWSESITHCPKGHAYTSDNIYWDGGYRKCKACALARAKARSAA